MLEQRVAPKKKSEFIKRWLGMEFGNRIQMWDTVEDLIESGYNGTVSVRSREVGGMCLTGVPIKEAITYNSGYYFNESPLDSCILFQGELMHSGDVGGYYIYGSEEKTVMREALRKKGEHFRGIQALGRLKAHCNPNGYEMLMDLLDTYPGAVIEFGVYSRKLGILPHNNTIIWEVRNY